MSPAPIKKAISTYSRKYPLSFGDKQYTPISGLRPAYPKKMSGALTISHTLIQDLSAYRLYYFTAIYRTSTAAIPLCGGDQV